MDSYQRAAISRGHSSHPMLRAARAAGYETLGDLSEALGRAGYPVGRSFLSQVMRRKKPCPVPLGTLLARMIDWRAE